MADINTNPAAGSSFSFRDLSHYPIVVNGLNKVTRFHRGRRFESPTATGAAPAAISPAAGGAATAPAWGRKPATRPPPAATPPPGGEAPAAPASVGNPATVATADKPGPAGGGGDSGGGGAGGS